jgi:hypothetical protein
MKVGELVLYAVVLMELIAHLLVGPVIVSKKHV